MGVGARRRRQAFREQTEADEADRLEADIAPPAALVTEPDIPAEVEKLPPAPGIELPVVVQRFGRFVCPHCSARLKATKGKTE